MVLNGSFRGFNVSLAILSSALLSQSLLAVGKAMLHSCKKPQYPLAQSLHVSFQAY